jgi:hypothetical protein
MSREYNNKIDDDPEYPDVVMTLDEWFSHHKNQTCFFDQGDAKWAKDGKYCDKSEAFTTEPEDATHVIWIDK